MYNNLPSNYELENRLREEETQRDLIRRQLVDQARAYKKKHQLRPARWRTLIMTFIGFFI